MKGESKTKKSRKVCMDKHSQLFANDFGKIIKQRRKEMNLTLVKAGEKLQLTAAYLSDIEKGKERPLTGNVLERLFTLYNFNKETKVYLHRLSAKCRGKVTTDLAGLVNGYDNLWVQLINLIGLREELEDDYLDHDKKMEETMKGVSAVLEKVIIKYHHKFFPYTKVSFSAEEEFERKKKN